MTYWKTNHFVNLKLDKLIDDHNKKEEKKMNKKRRRIRSVNDFKNKYFPQEAAKRIYEEKTPQELGILWARDAFKKLKKRLKNCHLI